jgi:hypothetical protein
VLDPQIGKPRSTRIPFGIYSDGGVMSNALDMAK